MPGDRRILQKKSVSRHFSCYFEVFQFGDSAAVSIITMSLGKHKAASSSDHPARWTKTCVAACLAREDLEGGKWALHTNVGGVKMYNSRPEFQNGK
jgi:hypothetical protein